MEIDGININANIEQLQKLIDNSNSIDCDIVLINSVNIIKSQQKEIDELKEALKSVKDNLPLYNELHKDTRNLIIQLLKH